VVLRAGEERRSGVLGEVRLCVIEEGRREGGMKFWDEPRPFFDLIKECYSSWYCGQGGNGDPVCWKRRVCV